MLDGCPVFPGDNAWNTDVTTLRVRQESTAWLKSVNGAGVGLHPDFGSDPDYGIPYLVVPATQLSPARGDSATTGVRGEYFDNITECYSMGIILF